MLITITVISILGITALTWIANKILPFQVCPICAGVFLTWTWLLGAYFLGYEIALVIPALLMGGTAVGIAYQLEKKLMHRSAEMRLLFKILLIPAGFVAAYGILAQMWVAAFAALVFLLLLSFLFLSRAPQGLGEETISDIEKRMKDCC